MALRGCLRCLKYTVFLLNLVVWLCGMALLGLGLFLRMDPFTNHVITTAHTSDIELFALVCYVLIGAGGVMTFVGFLGCCSAFQESRCMLGTFFVVLLSLIVVQAVAAGFVFMHRDMVHRPVSDSLSVYIQKVYGKEIYTDEPIDYIQRTLRCCGVHSADDWRQTFWFDSPGNKDLLPGSCCSANQTTLHGDRPVRISPHCGKRTDWSGIGGKQHNLAWKDGCANSLISLLEDRLYISALVFIIVSSVQVFSLCLSIALCCGMQREAAGGYKS